jgi:uncharacterized membrane protein HdeD (DUF308 family)
MQTINTLLFIIAGLWLLFFFIRLRQKVRQGQIVVPPIVAGHLLFLVCYLVVLWQQWSAWHLLWLIPLSFIVGTLSLFSVFVQKVTMSLLILLAWPLDE